MPSTTIRLCSGPPPRTAILPSSSLMPAAPGNTWSTWKTFSNPPAVSRTADGSSAYGRRWSRRSRAADRSRRRVPRCARAGPAGAGSVGGGSGRAGGGRRAGGGGVQGRLDARPRSRSRSALSGAPGHARARICSASSRGFRPFGSAFTRNAAGTRSPLKMMRSSAVCSSRSTSATGLPAYLPVWAAAVTGSAQKRKSRKAVVQPGLHSVIRASQTAKSFASSTASSEPEGPSALSATIGSVLAARRAGIALAANAASVSSRTAAANARRIGRLDAEQECPGRCTQVPRPHAAEDQA